MSDLQEAKVALDRALHEAGVMRTESVHIQARDARAIRRVLAAPPEAGDPVTLDDEYADHEWHSHDGEWCDACVKHGAALAAASGPTLGVERLAEAITTHRVAYYTRNPNDYLGHACMGDCAEDIAARLRAAQVPRVWSPGRD